jgi:N-acetylglucosamine malate deacetylase 1
MQKVDILAFGAHPDDVEYGAGGFMLKACDDGQKTAIIDLTPGDKSTHGTVQDREKEAKNASSILGLSYRDNLAIPDNTVNHLSHEQTLLVIEQIRLFKPSVILAPYYNDLHPDHAECGLLVERAVFFANVKNHHTGITLPPHKVDHIFFYQLHTNFDPSFIIDISSVIDKKIKGIYAHVSQFFYEQDGVYSLRKSDFEEVIRHKNGVQGRRIGAEYGEAFYSKKYIGFNAMPNFISGTPKE